MAISGNFKTIYLALPILVLAASPSYASGPLYAAPGYQNDYSNENFCVELQNGISRLSSKQKSGDWPALIQNKDITFLHWKDIDPVRNMDLIEENDVLVQMEAPYIYSANFNQFHFSIDLMWHRFALPLYHIAIALNSMGMQEAEFDSLGKKITIVRYGIKPQLMGVHSFSNNENFMQYYWTNFIKAPSNDGSNSVEYPISIPGYMYYGELVVVDGKLSLFATSGTTSFELDEITLPDLGVKNLILAPAFKNLILSPACPSIEVGQ